MKTRLNHLHEKLFASYWFIPTLMCVCVIVVAFLTLRYDRLAAASGRTFDRYWVDLSTAEGAREFLSTIAGSTITLAGVIFSITILALSFASSQYGPRLLRNFMRDRPSQFVLGAFVSTYLYCLLVLRTVGGGTGDPSVPHTAIAGAMLLALATTGVLIFFIHHVARSIQVSSIIHGVWLDLDRLIQAFVDGERAKADGNAPVVARGVQAHTVNGRRPGYVQALSHEDLIAIAGAVQGTIEMRVAPGDYLSAGLPIATLCTDQSEVPQEVFTQLQEVVVIGTQRTNEQDIEFPVDQLAEIAVRALSPSLNDPFTAIMCINRLGGALNRLAACRWPEPVLRNAAGRPVVNLLPTSMERLLNRAFGQILHYGGSNPVIVRQVIKMLAQAAGSATPTHAPAIIAYADGVMADASSRGMDRTCPELRRLHEAAAKG